jgi:hypothetical protein
MSFVVKQMELGIMMLSERSHTENEKYHTFSDRQNIELKIAKQTKSKTMNVKWGLFFGRKLTGVVRAKAENGGDKHD